MSTNEEASPICRGKNLSWETIMLFFNNMPKEPMPKDRFNSFVEEKINSWTQTHSQIARQLAFYYEDKGICYPRFNKASTLSDLFDYMVHWAHNYFVPNPFTPSLKGKEPTSIYSYLIKCIEEGITEFDMALDSMYGMPLSSHDKVRVYLQNYTNIKFDQGVISFNESLIDDSFIKEPTVDVATNPKHYFLYFDKKAQDINREAIEDYDNLPRQQIFYGAPGTGKSFKVDDVCKKYRHFRTTFHPDSDYSTFVGCYKPTKDTPMPIYGFDSVGHTVKAEDSAGKTIKKQEITYKFIPQSFTNAYIEAWRDLSKPVFLVIEEINRGNCAQIFGDLFQLLDRQEQGYSSYEIEPNTDLKNYIAEQNLHIEDVADSNDEDISDKLMSGELMALPPNLYIWATMNTSDQSLFPIDSAFKRRWDWKYVPINTEAKSGWQIEVNGVNYSWSSFLDKINAEIEDTTSSEDKQLGFFFCKADDTDENGNDGVITAEKFVSKVLFYIYNDVFKDYGFEREFFKDDKNAGKIISFRSFFKMNGDINEERVAQILTNLGVELLDYVDETEEEDEGENEDVIANESSSSTSSGSSYDRSKYAINGFGSYGKGSVAHEALKIYVANNPTKTSKEIVDDWLALGVNVPNFVETSDMFENRTEGSKDPNLKSRYKTVTLPNGEIIYVSNQYGPERIADLMSKINSTDWGIRISIV